MKGFLLGAGFSYDRGMPLASCFTDMFLSYLNPERACSMLEGMKDWRPYGKDIPLSEETIDDIKRTYEDFVKSGCRNYEELFRQIEDKNYDGTGQHTRNELYIIGYSFGDMHINHRIEHAMHLSDSRKVTIINPADLTYRGWDVFSYDMRLRHHKLSFSEWADYERTGTWAPYVKEDMEKAGIIRTMIYGRMRKQVLALGKTDN